MKINKTLRKELLNLLPSNYRKLIVERLSEKGITIHPNTVSNTLYGGNNETVALELIKLANECKIQKAQSQKEFDKTLRQLSAA